MARRLICVYVVGQLEGACGEKVEIRMEIFKQFVLIECTHTHTPNMPRHACTNA